MIWYLFFNVVIVVVIVGVLVFMCVYVFVFVCVWENVEKFDDGFESLRNVVKGEISVLEDLLVLLFWLIVFYV